MNHLRFVLSLPFLVLASILRIIMITMFYIASLIGDSRTAVFIHKTLNN